MTTIEIYVIHIRDASGVWSTIGGFNSYEAAAEATDQPDVKEWRIVAPDGKITASADMA